jgi:hypothetical protein
MMHQCRSSAQSRLQPGFADRNFDPCSGLLQSFLMLLTHLRGRFFIIIIIIISIIILLLPQSLIKGVSL